MLKSLVGPLRQAEEAKLAWYRHWVRQGLLAFERQLAALDAERSAQGMGASTLCYGTQPTLADCLLVPQIFNGQRFDTNMEGLPRTMATFEACMALPAFEQAQPSSCPDFTA